MNYEVKFHKDAMKYLKKIDKSSRIKILDQINLLALNPRNPELNIKKLQGFENEYRLRVGTYRILYSIYDDIIVIVIVKIGPRGDVYK